MFTRMTCLLLLCMLVLAAEAGAKPLIFPAGKAYPGGTGFLELAAPGNASSCRLSFLGAHRRVGPFRVSLGGPTRLVRWKIGHSAKGSWQARLSCRGNARRGLKRKESRSLGTFTRTIVIQRAGRGRGRVVAQGSLRAGPGSIPEMPIEAQASALSLPHGYKVDTTRREEPFVRCDGSKWVATTRTTGEGVGTLVQFEPTEAARRNAVNSVFNPFAEVAAEREDNPAYLEMWSDLEGCAHFTSGIPPEQLHSMYKQMACHARWGLASFAGGNTWDLEAWHRNVDWATALLPWKTCGNGYGDLPAETTGAFLVGRIVNGRAYAEAKPEEEIKAWLVYAGAPKPYRRHIASAKAYSCLLAAGHSKASWFPWTFLNQYVDKAPNITDAEACGLPASPAQPGSQPTPPQAPGAGTYVEQQGSLGANTFTNPYNASGMGPKIPPYGYVEVSCKVYAPQILSANPDGYWYRIHSTPWNDAYYAVANTFWNGDVPGQKPYIHNTDFNVRDC